MKIEGDDISAIEVSLHLEELRGNIMLRKEEQYLGPEIEAEKDKLTVDGEFDESIFNDIINDFYGKSSNSYFNLSHFHLSAI